MTDALKQKAREICAKHEGDNKGYQYLDGSRDDYPAMLGVVEALTSILDPVFLERMLNAAEAKGLAQGAAEREGLIAGITIMNEQTARMAEELSELRAERVRLRVAVTQGARWFSEYAEQHHAKARSAPDQAEQASRDDKAVRNDCYAKFLTDALERPST